MRIRLFSMLVILCFGAAGARAEDLSVPYRPWGIDRTGMDPAIAAGDDFYRHVNGLWDRRTAIPPDRPYAGVDRIMMDRVEAQVRRLLEGDVEGIEPGLRDEARKLVDFYASFMAEDRIAAQDLGPIRDHLDAIRLAGSMDDLARLQGQSWRRHGMSLVSFSIGPDSKDTTRYALHIGQRGLGLPERDHYLDPSFAEIKTAYEAYVAELLGFAGWPEPKAAASAIVAFETGLADESWNAADRLDPDKTYNPTEPALLERESGFPVRRLLAEIGLPALDRVIVAERSAVLAHGALWAKTDLATLRAWQAFHLLDQSSVYLPAAFVDANFRFRKVKLDGLSELTPRWKRAVAVVDAAMGEAIGRVYVARHVPRGLKAEMETMMGFVRQAFEARLRRNDWMSPETRAKALEKLARLESKLAWPTQWRDYGKLVVARDDLIGNVERAMAVEWQRLLDRFDRPVDREEWNSTPQTVNAFYDWNMNTVTLPAAQLQPPSFDPAADAAVNYGAIGSLLGHELIHGFDSVGRKFDGQGKLADWWAPTDAAEFERRSALLGRQFDKVQALPGLFVNGTLTMSENIADLGGALVALDAYRLSLGGREAPVIDGITGTQRFFLGFAQSWRNKTTDEWLRTLIVSDPHAPASVRVNNTVRNIDAWYEAFGTEPGHRLYLSPGERVRLW